MSLSPQTSALAELFTTLESGHSVSMLTLAITRFQADPQLVTDTIGLEPTSVGRTGETTPGGRLRNFNGWWHEVEAQRLVDGAQHDAALNRILALLSGREGHFAKLRALVRRNEVTIYGGLDVPTDAQRGIWLDPDQMQLLAACGVGWGLDLFAGD